MKKMLIILSLVFLAACEGQEKDEKSSFSCGGVHHSIQALQVGDDIDHDIQALTILQQFVPSVYQSGSYCIESFEISQFNENTYGWCYYYKIDIECDSGIIESIYKDHQ